MRCLDVFRLLSKSEQIRGVMRCVDVFHLLSKSAQIRGVMRCLDVFHLLSKSARQGRVRGMMCRVDVLRLLH